MPTYHSTAMRYKPVREIKLSKGGTLLAASAPRYDHLTSYIQQFAAPSSLLRGEGLWAFHDPLMPELTLLVQCETIDVCEQCARDLDACHCPF